MLGKKVGIDLGPLTVRAAVKGEGVVLEEPSLVALRKNGATISALGHKAIDLAQGDSEFSLVHPLHGTKIVDRGALVALLTHVINRAAGRQRIFKPDVVVAVHADMSGEDRRVVLDALVRANCRTSYLLDMPIAAGLGAGLPLQDESVQMIVDVGDACAEVTVVAGEGTLSGRTIELDNAGEGVLVRNIVNMGREVLAEVPRTVVSEIERAGILLVGGGAYGAGLPAQLGDAWGIEVRAANDPQLCSVLGAQMAVDSLDLLKRTFMYIR